MSHGVITVGDLTSMLLYTVYVGNGLSLLTCVYLTLLEGASADLIDQQIFLCEQNCRLRVVHKLICYGKASIMRAVGAGTRIFELLERKPIMKSSGNTTPSASRDVVSFENVYFEYPGRKGIAVLQNFNLQLTVGESVAIV